MSMVTGFDRTHRVDRRDVRPTERPVVLDILDAGPAFGHYPRQFGETTGPIADDRGESRQPTIVDQTLFNQPAEHRGVDITATEREHYFFAAELRQQPGHQRGERCRGGAL